MRPESRPGRPRRSCRLRRPGRPRRADGGAGRSHRSENGFATAFAVGLIGLLVTVTAVVAVLGGVLVDRRRAEAGADLAALAGAAAAQQGGDGCAAASRTARGNQTRVVACRQDGSTVVVEVERPPREVLGHRFTISGRARAGPVAATEVALTSRPAASPAASPAGGPAGSPAGGGQRAGGGVS